MSDIKPETLRDLLSLVEVDVALETIGAWTDDQCGQAADWAAAVHVFASDNYDVEVPPKPEFLP